MHWSLLFAIEWPIFILRKKTLIVAQIKKLVLYPHFEKERGILDYLCQFVRYQFFVTFFSTTITRIHLKLGLVLEAAFYTSLTEFRFTSYLHVILDSPTWFIFWTLHRGGGGGGGGGKILSRNSDFLLKRKYNSTFFFFFFFSKMTNYLHS